MLNPDKSSLCIFGLSFIDKTMTERALIPPHCSLTSFLLLSNMLSILFGRPIPITLVDASKFPFANNDRTSKYAQ